MKTERFIEGLGWLAVAASLCVVLYFATAERSACCDCSPCTCVDCKCGE